MYRHNDSGIACLDNEQHKNLFGYYPQPVMEQKLIRETRSLKQPQDLSKIKPIPPIPKLPVGKDIQEFYEIIAQEYFDYYDLDAKFKKLIDIPLVQVRKLIHLIPPLIAAAKVETWTKITINGDISYSDDYEPDISIFDTETFVKGSPCNSPIVGQGAGLDDNGILSLYLWLHEGFEKDEKYVYVPKRVPIGHDKVLIAHAANFDRQKVKETYEGNNNLWLDTKSMMQLVAGADEKQRWALNTDPRKSWKAAKLQKVACGLSLVKCYEFMYYPRTLPEGAKDLRNVFVKAETFQEFKDKKVEILEYSMLDVVYTLELAQKAIPAFLERSNHKAILCGQSIVIDAKVPHIDFFDQWVSRCDIEFERTEAKILEMMKGIATKIHQEWLDSDRKVIPERLKHLDWTLKKPFNWRKKTLPDGWLIRAKWYDKWLEGTVKTKGIDICLLLQCEYYYEGEWREVLYNKDVKYHVSYADTVVKLPNRNEPGANFGSLLSSDALYLIRSNPPLLRSAVLSHEEFQKFAELKDSTSTYTGFSKRVKAQNKANGWVAADVSPAGTVSGK